MTDPTESSDAAQESAEPSGTPLPTTEEKERRELAEEEVAAKLGDLA